MSVLGDLWSSGCRGGRTGVHTGFREGEKEARAREVRRQSRRLAGMARAAAKTHPLRSCLELRALPQP